MIPNAEREKLGLPNIEHNAKKKMCKVKVDIGQCESCWGMAEICDTAPNCGECLLRNKEYELLVVGTGFWSGDYAMVQADGKIEKVSLSRVYDIKEDK